MSMEERGGLPPSNQGVEMEGRETWQVGLIRFDFHLYPPLPQSLPLSTSCQPNHSLNLKIDGGPFDFFTLKESTNGAILLGRQARTSAEAHRRGAVALPSGAGGEYFVYSASASLTRCRSGPKCFRLLGDFRVTFPSQQSIWLLIRTQLLIRHLG